MGIRSGLLLILLALLFIEGCAHSKHENVYAPPPEESTLTDEQEYNLGRGVAAEILKKFPPVDSPFNVYATTLARYLATSTSRPTTFKGYRAVLIRSSDNSAFSTPGGFIFISTRLVESLQSEDELAGVLAHEVAHVVLRHGELAVDRSQLAAQNRSKTSGAIKTASGILSVFSEVTGDHRAEDASKISKRADKIYEDSAGEIHEKLLVSGYSQDQEYAADAMALEMMLLSGYRPAALGEFLARVFSTEKRLKGKDFAGFAEGTLFSTHPLDEKRVKTIAQRVRGWVPGPLSNARANRFQNAKSNIKLK